MCSRRVSLEVLVMAKFEVYAWEARLEVLAQDKVLYTCSRQGVMCLHGAILEVLAQAMAYVLARGKT